MKIKLVLEAEYDVPTMAEEALYQSTETGVRYVSIENAFENAGEVVEKIREAGTIVHAAVVVDDITFNVGRR